MRNDAFLIRLGRLDASHLFLLSLAALALAAAVLYRLGLIGWALAVFGRLVRGTVWAGFRLWERTLAWASWPLFLAILVALLGLGWAATERVPALTVLSALVPLYMGTTAC